MTWLQEMGEASDCLGAEHDDIVRYLGKAAQYRNPLTVSFELTRRCSFRCVHCYLGDQKIVRACKSQELDTAAVIRLIDEMAAAGTLFLTLTGGDPMLRPDFLDIYRHAVRNGLLVTVFCNGSLIKDEIVSTFVEYPPRAVEITLYGASQETFEAVTQTPGSYAACMRGVEKLRQAKVRLRLLQAVGRDALGIGVAVDGRTVTLEGDVPSAAVRDQAARAARETPGVETVDVRLATP